MSVRAGRYNTKLHKYEDVLLPDECRTYEDDMEKMVPCAQCGRMFRFGYAVCAECYDDKTDRFLKEHEPSKVE